MPLSNATDSTGPPRPSRFRRWAGRLLLLVSSVGFSLVLAEGIVRLVRPQQLILLRPDVWVPHAGLGWVQAPEVDTRINTGEREVRFLTDEYGHRIGSQPMSQVTHRVLALGDSFLAAIQVEYEQTFAALAEQRLSAELGASTRVVNTAVGGWGPSQYRLRTRQELERQSYDLVVAFLYLGNDVTGRDIEFFAPRENSIRHRFHWPRRATRQAIVDGLLYPANDALERRSHLYVLFKNQAWFLLVRWGLSARSFPSLLLPEQADSERWATTSRVCADLQREAEARGIPVLFVLLPGISEIDPEVAQSTARAFGVDPERLDLDQPSRRMSSELEKLGLKVLDMTPALRAARAAGRRDLYGSVDAHFAPAGHQVVADALVPLLLDVLRSTSEEAPESSS